jgi:hypothetical protein
MSLLLHTDVNKQHKKHMWLVYASEVAAAIGKNKYKKRWEVLLNVWKRLDRGASYRAAVQRAKDKGLNVQTKEAAVQEAIEHTNIKTIVDDLLQHKPQTSQQVHQLLEDFHMKLTDTDAAQQTKLQELEGDVMNETKAADSLQQDIGMLYQDVEACADQEQKALLTQKIEVKRADLKDVQTVLVTHQETLTNHRRIWNNYKEAKKDVSSQLKTRYGDAEETKNIKTQEFGLILDNNHQFYKDVLGVVGTDEESIRWGVGGRIDGFRNNVLIEIKNRVRQIFDKLPDYDVVQLQCYMHILNQPKAVMIQRLTQEWGEGKVHTEVKETVVRRDHGFWDNEILPNLTIFVKALKLFHDDEALQDRVLATADNVKYRALNPLFTKAKKPAKKTSKKPPKKRAPKRKRPSKSPSK